MSANKNVLVSPMLWLLVSLTVGLAPFVPEPHVWEKLKWIFSGADDMRPIDWFDLFLHGAPWVLLAYSVINKFANK